MTTKKTEEISRVEKMTKQEMAKIIKTAKKEADSSGKEMDKKALQAFDTYWKSIANMTISQIDMAANFAKMYVQFRLATIDSYDRVAHIMMDSYAQAWNQLYSDNKK